MKLSHVLVFLTACAASLSMASAHRPSSPRLAIEAIIHTTSNLVDNYLSTKIGFNNPLHNFSTALSHSMSSVLNQLDEYSLSDTPMTTPDFFPHATMVYGNNESSAVQDNPPSIGCLACKYLGTLLVTELRKNSTIDLIELLAVEYCLAKKIYGGIPEVCAGMIQELGYEVVLIATEKYLAPSNVCAFLKLCPPSQAYLDTFAPMMRNTDTEQAKAIARAGLTAYGPVSPRTVRPVLPRILSTPGPHVLPPDVGTFMQFSDLHYDALYTPGTNPNCIEPLCCRPQFPGNATSSAGKYGDFNCDTSPEMLSFLSTSMAAMQPPPDFVLWTGDDPPHDVWKQSREENLAAVFNVTQAFINGFPSSPVFGVMGNHESFPVDQNEGPPYDSWLNTAMANDWKQWLDNDAYNTFAYAGYYSILVRPGLRVVSLNTQYCDEINFWLLLNDTDPGQQLQWLIQVFQNARQNNEKLMLMGHIPLNDGGCYPIYASTIVGLIQNNSDLVVGSFFGHTHHDSYFMIRDSANTVPLSRAFVCPSVTTYTDIFPSARMYFYNRTTMEIIDYHQYFFNITDANMGGEPQWRFGYSPIEEYNMTGMAAGDFQDLLVRLTASDTLWDTFYYHYDTQHLGDDSCEGHCREAMLCYISSSNADSSEKCFSKGREYVKAARLESVC